MRITKRYLSKNLLERQNLEKIKQEEMVVGRG